MTYRDFEHFFGRSAILELLKKRVVGLKDGYRQNVALLGDQYLGKSSIVQRFLQDLDDPDIISIYLDLEHRDGNYFYSKFTGSLLYHFLKSQKLPLHEDLNLLQESAKHLIPNTVQVIGKIRSDMANGKTSAAMQGLLSLPEVFTNETGKFCLLILDEFHNL
ncbi:MAG: ATP-binding protein, partial [Candidatus Omnitrophota bacterium]|nr:ATP-binding protein [Candidatus Omnitrophota bacterium]